jgi:DNA-binding CsgD family transcriptional regulator/tetratricopeptide (TPR) repeat protein
VRFVGRRREGERLRHLLAGAAGGRGGAAVAVVGEAGVGKSALVEHALVGLAAGPDAKPALWRVTGVEVESDLAHVGLAVLLGQAAGALADLDATDPGSAAALRAATGRDADAGPGSGPAASTVGLRLHMAALALVAAAAARGPLVLVVDDAHWIDSASLGVLAFVARRVGDDRVAVLLTGRPSGDLDVALAGIERLDLAPLPEAEAASLLAGYGVAAPVAAACWRATGGNALALVELAAALGPDERAGRAPLPEPIPVAGPIREVFARRLAPFDAAARAALAVVAVEATGAAGVVAKALAAHPLGLGPAALRPAEDAGLVTRVGGDVRWQHPLARAAVVDALAPSVRRSAHQAVARALAGEGQGSRLVFHLAAAAEGPDEAVADGLEEVARLSTGQGAMRAAATAWAAAAELSVDDGARFARRLAGVEARWLAGEVEAVLRAGRPLLEAETDPARRAKLAVLVGQATAWWEGPIAGARHLTAEAGRARAADPTSAGYLYLYAAQSHLLALRPRAVVDVAGRAGREGLVAGDLGVAMMAQALEGFGRLLLGEVATARAKLVPLVDVALGLLASGVEGASSMAQVLSFAAVADERWDDARALMDGIIAEGERSGHVGMTVLAHDQLGELEWRQGRWAEAAGRAAHALLLSEGHDQDQPLVHQGRLRVARLDAGRGRTASARPPAEAALAIGRRTGWQSLVIWAHEVLALAAAADDHADEALDHLDALAVLTADAGVRHPGLLWWQAAHVEALVARGRKADAQVALVRLRDESGETGGLWPAAALARGEAALVAAGDPDRAVESLDEAVDSLRRLGAGFELARALLARGRHHRARVARGRAAAEADAVRDLTEARARFAHLDARPWADRAARLAGPTPPPRPPASLASRLTDAELRVALVVGNGATNRRAAEELFLSIKTVDSHLQSIYRRLDIRSRSQLAALVARELGPDSGR